MPFRRAAGRARALGRRNGVVGDGFRLAERSEEHQCLCERRKRLRPKEVVVGRGHARGASMFRQRPILMPERPLHATTSLVNRHEDLRVSALAERRTRRFEIGRRSVRESSICRDVGGGDQELGSRPIRPVG